MGDEGFKRKLTAILSADVSGYSRLMRDNEEATVHDIAAHRVLISNIIQQHNGRVIDSPGDNILAEFASVVDAVNGAIKIQTEIKRSNADTPEDRRMEFRIGVNLGDVIEEDERIYGDGVNIAARVEGLAARGGISISGTVYEHIKDKLSLGYHYLGEQEVKNISEPVRVYRLLTDPTDAGKVISERKPKSKKFKWAASIAIAIIILVVGGIAIWNYYFRPSFEPASVEKMAFPLPEKPSIAVLPFDNMSGDPEQQYFSDGLTDELIGDLAKISGILVISRNSAFAYKGKQVKIGQIAKELNVRYVLEGSVQKSGDKVRIRVQLIEGQTDYHLWAESYDGVLNDIFDLQDKITSKIVSALKVKLLVGEQEFIDRKDTENIKAYDAFLQGWNYYLRNTPEDWAKAISHFEEAVELDPDYSRAYAAIAMIYWRYGRIAKKTLFIQKSELNVNYHEASVRAREYLHLAMRKPTSIYYRLEALMALYRRQYKKALAEAEHAVDLEPNDADGINTLAYILIAIGEPDRSVELINKGMQLDPHNIAQPLYLLGVAHFAKGQLTETVSMIERALKHNPKLYRIAPILPASLAHLGEEMQAKAELQKLKESGNFDLNFRSIMFNFPFQDPEVIDRLVDGLRKAGLPAVDFNYYKLFQKNMLDGDAIRELAFGQKVVETWVHTRYRHWIERTEDGEATWSSGPDKKGDFYGSGRSWIEDDMLCDQWDIRVSGLKHCMSVFRNPEGTQGRKNEFIAVSDFGFQLISPVD